MLLFKVDSLLKTQVSLIGMTLLEYAIQLMEKQKAKYSYGILERQFRILFERANRSKGVTGEVLLQLCESRLDNVVYRLGIAPTRSAARQLVSHRHITVNGSLNNIPSTHIKAGDVIGVREKSKSLSYNTITGITMFTFKMIAILLWFCV